MKTSLRDLTQGPLARQIFLFSLPLIFSNLLQILFNMADVAVVGRFAGSMALGSVGSTSTLVILFTGFLIGLSGGVNVLVARSFGMRDKRLLERTVHSSALICLCAGLLILTVGQLFCRDILELLRTKEELIEGASLYLRIYFLGMPALALYNFGHAVFSAVGNPVKPLRYLVVAGIVNVALNLVFVIAFDMDVAGVAWASVISQYLSAVLVLVALFRVRDDYRLRITCLKPDLLTSKEILSLGVPSGLQNSIFQLANLFVQFGVNSFDAVMVAGNSAAANADALVFDVMAAFYTACGSFIGQNYGAGKRDRVKKSYGICLLYSFAVGTVMGVFLVAFGKQFLSLFTADPAVVEAGMHRLLIMGCFYGLSAFMDCSIAASRGLGKSVVPTVIVLMGSCVFRVVWIYTVFAYFGTVPSLYLLYAFSWALTGIAEVLYLKSAYRKQMRLLEERI